MWTWLARNKDTISSLGTVLQSVAVIAGIAVIINEFLVKDRVAERARVGSVMAIFQGPDGMNASLNIGDLLFNVIGKTKSEVDDVIHEEGVEVFQGATARAIRRYTQLQTCLKANTCDHFTAKHLFCDEAFLDAFVAYKAIIRPWNSTQPNYDTRIDNLFDFHLDCVKEGHITRMPDRWLERRTSGWDESLELAFRSLDEKWRKVSDNIEEVH